MRRGCQRSSAARGRSAEFSASLCLVCRYSIVPLTRLCFAPSPLHCVYLVKLNGNRQVTGVLRGFDQFMNLVLEDSVELVSATERANIGTMVLRGNSVLMIECLDKL